MSQPSIPIALPGRRRNDTGVSEAELAEVHRRTSEEGLCVLGLRFSEDLISPGARFEALKERLKDGFRVIELDSSCGNSDRFRRRAHSVLTAEVREEPRNGATRARDEVAAFLHERLDAGR
ncbi:hypothetical protein [Agromyces mariniharenae]|uniref:Uncharacterized protein n=1 Tax=Agromyces mariniharenae TaxID=2604423 RepID=A0A5S4V1N0_9MICO|nr:hypothetical protein [Agromyces mariniharenae]TYL53044.1 hypothetical protein FYC51_04830 [Agromyces mariniharenae]